MVSLHRNRNPNYDSLFQKVMTTCCYEFLITNTLHNPVFVTQEVAMAHLLCLCSAPVTL